MSEYFLIFLVPASRDQLDEEVEEERRCEYNVDTFIYLPCGVPPPAAYAMSTLKGTDLGFSSSGQWIFFNFSVYRSYKILSLV
jgi:hypothetical protein